MVVVDFHTHVFPPEFCARREVYCSADSYFAELYADPRARMVTVEDLLAEMDAAHVGHSVLCGFGWSTHELCVAHNNYLLECIHSYPDRFSALAALQPLSGRRARSEVSRCIAGGMKGVGELMPGGQGYSLGDSDEVNALFGLAAEAGFLIMTHASEPVGHLYPGKQRVTPDVIWPLVQRYPEAKLVLAHWGGGYPFYELMPEVRRASVNVYYDSAASSYLYSPEVFVHLSRIVGYEKLLWGTDYPVLKQSRFLDRVMSLPLDPTEREAILGANAARLLELASD